MHMHPGHSRTGTAASKKADDTQQAMGASGSAMSIVPSPLELHGSAGGLAGAARGATKPSVLPLAYRHLSHFPVLAKVARGPIKPHPNDRITQ